MPINEECFHGQSGKARAWQPGLSRLVYSRLAGVGQCFDG